MYDKTSVLYVQTALNKLGENLVTDGIYGGNTKNAIMRFQTKNGLKSDGLISSELIKKLGGSSVSVSSSTGFKDFISKNGKNIAIGSSVVALIFGIYFVRKMQK